jgi:membrane associated rhomboid family serine protease
MMIIDYSNYSLEELLDVKSNIDANAFPDNYQALMKELRSRERVTDPQEENLIEKEHQFITEAYLVKLKYILPIYLVASSVTILMLLVIRWLLSIRFEILDIHEEVWDVWIPMILAGLTMHFSLKGRLKVLYFEENSENKRFGFQCFAWFCLLPAIYISQNLLTTATSKLLELGSANEINQTLKARYYKIDTIKVIKGISGSHSLFETSGRHREHLDFGIYFVFPIDTNVADQIESKPRLWLGIKYSKRVSNRLEPQQKERNFDQFYSDSLKKLEQFNLNDIVMLERLPTSQDKDMFLRAVETAVEEPSSNQIIILQPSYEDFENLNGDKLEWLFYSFGIGVLGFIFILLFPGYDKNEHDRQLSGVEHEKDFKYRTINLLIPEKDYLVAPILINLNIIVFVIGVIAGIQFLNPSAQELLEWGGNRRLETTNGEWWRLFTSMFLHGGVIHLMLNCLGLVLASTFIEQAIGKWRFIAIYILSGLCGSIASILWYENTVSVGASGAIFGLFGATLGLLLTNAYSRSNKKQILSSIAIFVGINLVWGLSGGVDNAAHTGGLLSGFLIGFFIYIFTKDKGKFEI